LSLSYVCMLLSLSYVCMLLSLSYVCMLLSLSYVCMLLSLSYVLHYLYVLCMLYVCACIVGIQAPEILCYLLMYINPSLNKDYLLLLTSICIQFI
jgi:hypothetical protein